MNFELEAKEWNNYVLWTSQYILQDSSVNVEENYNFLNDVYRNTFNTLCFSILNS